MTASAGELIGALPPDVAAAGGALRVVHVVNELQLAGLERVIAELVEGQRLAGIDSIALVVHEAGQLGERLHHAGYPITVLNAPLVRPWQRVPELMAWLRRERHDVVHMHGGNWWSYGKSIRRATTAPFVYTLHGEQYPPSMKIHAVELMGAVRTSHLVLVSEDLRQYSRRWWLDRWCPLDVVQNGILKLDLEFVRPPRRPGPLRVLHVARLDSVKRQDVTLRALRRLLDAGIDARVEFCGKGGDKPMFTAIAAELGLEAHVDWLGVVPESDVHERMLTADALILPSDSEGTSIALLEAIAVGLPCIVSNVGDSGRVMRAAPQWIIGRSDVEGAVRALGDLAHDPTAALATAERVKVDVRARYGRQAMIDAYREIYERVTGR